MVQRACRRKGLQRQESQSAILLRKVFSLSRLSTEQKALVMQRQNIHRKRDGDMQYQTEPYASVFVTQPAEENAGDDGRNRFGGRLAEMDHAIRHGHYK